ncbi:MAG: Phospholipase [Naasia sp.]|jgi:phospholipase/carboxylesterase|uniref:alpha/beta hydrolase n=1 Tax=Naasia sp. TaxID=2546198 RepID=UPI00260E8131|nr:alpha/beta fold hydrolase [Naasia sp.]MCU1570060.1 Phospholipase [Naasia sp.]
MTDAGQPRVDPDAVLWSSAPKALADRPLLILLHGVGADEGDLFSFSPRLPLHPVIASLRAPSPYGAGWSWYELGTPGEPNSDGVDAAARAVLRWLDELPVAPPSIGLLGFSQGAAVATQMLRHAPDRFAYLVHLSGYVTSGDLPGDAQLERRRPPVFWGRGTVDEVIPGIAIEHTEQWLPRHSSLESHIYEDLGHSVSNEELADVVAFLGRRQA